MRTAERIDIVMVKTVLSNFKLNIGSTGYDGALPFSLCSALTRIGAGGAEEAVEHEVKSISAVFSLKITAAELSSKHHSVIFRKVRAPFSVYLNDEAVTDITADREKLHLDLSGRLAEGDNKLELRFVLHGEESLYAGIYGGGEYIRYNNAIIDNIAIDQRIDGGVVNLGISLSLFGEADNIRAVATLISASGQIYYGGLTRCRGSIVIKDPLYWWPKGLGVQNLYRLTVNLYGESEVEDTLETRVGIRKLSTPTNQKSAHLEVGGVPFLPMGAVYHPIAEKTPEGYSKKLRAAVTNAAMAGFNALVVPSGCFAPEELYELCDVNGIVVIKEFRGESDGEYRELVDLSRHPSLGFVDFASTGDEAIAAAERMQSMRPDLEFSMITGFAKYPETPSLPTEKSCFDLLGDGERNLFSEAAMRLTEGRSVELLEDISENYLCPRDLSEAAYLSGLVASDRVGAAVMRARLDPEGGRAVFESLTDDRRLLSGSTVDCFGRRKALHYKVENIFRPLCVFAERDGYSVGFSVSNERRLAFIGVLEFKIVDNRNRVIYKEIVDCQVAKNASKKIMTRDLSEYLKDHENEYYLEYYIKEGLTTASRGTLLFTKPKSFKLLDPKLHAEIAGRDRRYSITLSAEAFAKGVEISFAEHEAVLFENYLDLTQNAPYKISFTLLSGEDSTYALAKSIKLRSLYDIK